MRQGEHYAQHTPPYYLFKVERTNPLLNGNRGFFGMDNKPLPKGAKSLRPAIAGPVNGFDIVSLKNIEHGRLNFRREACYRSKR